MIGSTRKFTFQCFDEDGALFAPATRVLVVKKGQAAPVEVPTIAEPGSPVGVYVGYSTPLESETGATWKWAWVITDAAGHVAALDGYFYVNAGQF